MHDEKKRSARPSSGAVEGPAKPGLLRRFSSALAGDQQGTASIEALIMLPFFIMVWGLLLFTVDVYKHKIDAGIRARDCGWTFAQTGCETVPASCQEEPGDPISTEDSAGSGELASSVDDLPIDIPIIGDVLNGVVDTIFGELRRARHESTVQRPQILGSTTVHTRGAFAIMCNERPRTIGEMATDMVCAVAPFFCG